jgi:hypothetical protein
MSRSISVCGTRTARPSRTTPIRRTLIHCQSVFCERASISAASGTFSNLLFVIHYLLCTAFHMEITFIIEILRYNPNLYMTINCKIGIDCLFMARPWFVEMTEGENPSFTFVRAGWRRWRDINPREIQALLSADGGGHLSSAIRVDAWLMREEFFAIETPSEALSFFRKFGVWRYSRYEEDDPSNKFPVDWALDSEGDPLPISFDDLIYQRDYFESALSLGPSEWKRLTDRPNRFIGRTKEEEQEENDARINVLKEMIYLFGGSLTGPKINLAITPETLNSERIQGRLACHEIQDALRATILLDWVEGREWLICAEETCKRRFRRTSKHPMLYCSPRCSSRKRQTAHRKSKN